jgi:glucose/arabinose dehydrogenase
VNTQIRTYLTIVFLILTCAPLMATVPAGFSETQFITGLSNPTAMEFAPDGRLFVCEQGGNLRVIKNGALLSTPFVTLTVNSDGERGLLGIAFDPSFASNQFVYVYYTATTPTIHNRVSRFTANGDVAVANSELPLLDLDNLSSATNHNGGAIHFGPDGKLYIVAGENANGPNAQSFANVLGKALRINSDGTIPVNPFDAQTTGKNKAIWAMGLRNPFTFAFQPGSTRMFINDVGENTWEEINDGIAGSNYGWNNVEGGSSCATYRCPLFFYGHGSTSTTGCAITGGTFYNPPTVQFPTSYVGDYFFQDYCSHWIRKMETSDNSVTDFATTTITKPVDLKVGSDGTLYYLARGTGSSTGVVYKIQYTNNPPTGDGLSAVYYDNKDLTGTTITRIDPTINFNWKKGSPDPAIGADTFSARWTGFVQPEFSEMYTFYTLTNDGVRLWVDGQLIIDRWVNNPQGEGVGTIVLTGGVKYSITMEYYENKANAAARLSWSSPSQVKQIVPMLRLYSQ